MLNLIDCDIVFSLRDQINIVLPMKNVKLASSNIFVRLNIDIQLL